MLTTSTCWRRAFYVAAFVSAVSVAEATVAQDHRGDRNLDDYETLLDSILPRDLCGTLYGFALRLMPSFRLESQLVMRVHDDATVSAEITQVTERSAWEALLGRLETDRPFRIGALASTIKVQRQMIEVDLATAQRWQDSLLNASRASTDELQRRARAGRRSRNETVVVVADGTLGEVWYSQRGVHLHWGPFQVPEPGEKSDSAVHVPIARWMTEVMETARGRVRGEQPQ